MVSEARTKTLVLGLGNPILGDDSIGLCVARALEGKLNQQSATVMEASLSGLNLLEQLVGFDKAIIIDAIQTRGGKAGQIYRLEPEAFNTTRRTLASHDVSFTSALELGKKLGLALPRQIVIFAIEVAKIGTFSEQCTQEVESSIPAVVNMVVDELAASSSTSL